MTSLSKWILDWDWSTRRVAIQTDADSAYAILGDRNAYESGGTRRIFNWIGAGNWLYRDYHGRAAGQDADSYSTFMRTNYAIIWDFRPNGFVLDLNGNPPRADMRPHRYDTGLYDTLSVGRDSWGADLRSYTVTFLASH